MTEAAIISGSLVDVRNVGTHKSVKLTIHVPEELAMQVMEAFGWPTGVNPVEVAIARLNTKSSPAVSQAEKQPGPATPGKPVPVRADKEKRKWSELNYAQQAGIRCADPVFWAFLRETNRSNCNDEADAADFVRHVCGVASRKDINPAMASGLLWESLDAAYDDWQALDRVSA